MGKKLKLNILLKKICEKAKGFFEIPDFRQYVIADGIYRILFASKTGIMPNLERREAEGQLLLLFPVQLSKKSWGKPSKFVFATSFLSYHHAGESD